MQKLKQILAIILVLAIALSLPITAFSESQTSYTNSGTTYAIIGNEFDDDYYEIQIHNIPLIYYESVVRNNKNFIDDGQGVMVIVNFNGVGYGFYRYMEHSVYNDRASLFDTEYNDISNEMYYASAFAEDTENESYFLQIIMPKDSEYLDIMLNSEDIKVSFVYVADINDFNNSALYVDLDSPAQVYWADMKPNNDISTFEFGEITPQIYKGKPIKVCPSVSDGENALEENVDYTFSWKNNTDVGTATVIINGIGEYSGTKEINFDIVPKKTKLKAKKSGKKTTLSWSKVSGIEKYEIYYSENGGKYKLLTTVDGSKTSFSTSKLKAGNKYSFKIRSYTVVGDETFYSAFSSVVKLST